MKCRLCDSKTIRFLSLGKTPLPEEFRTLKQMNDTIVQYPLSLTYCEACSHIQLASVINPDLIYKQNYFYDYSITRTGKKHWQHLAQEIFRRFNLTNADLVVDIGSNTGTLLELFKKLHVRVLGIDPSARLSAIAEKQGIPTIVDYFSPDAAEVILKKYGRAKIITCTNVFDHVENLHEWAKAAAILLEADGICVIEVPYFPVFLQKKNHVVYHQQIDYVMLSPLIPFFNKHTLQISHVELIPLHGGSIRIYISPRKNVAVDASVQELLKMEEEIIRNRKKVFEKFARSVYLQKKNFIKLLNDLKKKNVSIAAAGASAKGITFLNYCSIGPETIDFISEKSPLKIGTFTPTGIPVTSDREIFNRNPDYVVILAWNFADEIMKNLNRYKGWFIIPIPESRLIDTYM